MKEYKQNCCKKRTILEKILIVVIVLLLCLLIALFSVFVLHLQNGKRDTSVRYKPVERHVFVAGKKAEICMTSGCVQAASQVISFLDQTIDPCEDFYGFVCGTFLNKSTARNEITPLSKFEAITLNQLDALITEPIDGPLPKSWELQRKYYKTCMDSKAIETDDSYTFSNLIKELGDWPVLHGRFWDERKFNWLSSTVKCRTIGFVYENFLGISANAGNGTGPILLAISPPAVVHLPYQLREFYIDVMANISIELGAPSYLAKNEFIRVYKFEEELKTFAQDENENGKEEIVKVSKLQTDFPSIDWIDFLNKVTGTSTFTDNTSIRFRARRYLINLLNLLGRTPKSTQANYVVWKIIENFRSYLKESVRGRYEAFLITLNPNYAFMGNRHLYCLNKAKFYFPSVAELAYVRKYLQPEERRDVTEMAAKIKAQLVERIRANDWLDRMSKNVSLNQIRQVEEHIGSSDLAYNGDFDKVVEMEGFDLYTDNILEMATKLYAKRADNYFRIVNKDTSLVTKEALQKSPILSINAFYNRDFKTLVVPAPFLQGVIYDYKRPQYMNYGALGSIIGHEYVHGFVADGKNAENNARWSSNGHQMYREKIQCLLDDYKSYTGHLKEFTKSAKNALEENIADLIGPNLAYEAYQQQIRTHGKEQTLPGVPYTQNQLFWITSGTFRCYQPKLQPNLPFDQNHGVPSFAVVSSVRNSKTFAADFNCPVGSTMNPEKKCQIL